MRIAKLIAATLAASTIAGAALAADLPRRPPPAPYIPPPPVFTWTGLYVGLNAGYETSADRSIRGAELSNGYPTGVAYKTQGSSSGFIGGGQIGYNYQFGSIVAGVEVDFQGSTAKGVSQGYGGTTYNGINYGEGIWTGNKVTAYGTLRGRVGYTILPTLLLYVTGGLAYGDIQHRMQAVDTNNTAGSSYFEHWAAGFTIGGGVEYAFSQNWSAKVEYAYVDLSSTPWMGTGLINQDGTMSSRYIMQKSNNGNHTVRAGVNYHFNSTPPVIPVLAKY